LNPDKKLIPEVVEEVITMTDMITSLFNDEVAKERSIGKEKEVNDHKIPLEDNSSIMMSKEDDYIKYQKDKNLIGDRKSETINALKEEEFLKSHPDKNKVNLKDPKSMEAEMKTEVIRDAEPLNDQIKSSVEISDPTIKSNAVKKNSQQTNLEKYYPQNINCIRSFNLNLSNRIGN
jgi:hypothetical protein